MNNITDSVRTTIGITIGGGGPNPTNPHSFYGNFNGNNHTITLAIRDTTTANSHQSALFGGIYDTLQNLVIDGYVIYVVNDAFGFSTENAGTIINCTNNAYIYSPLRAAGIVGRDPYTANTQIINCKNNGTIEGLISAHGITHSAFYGIVSNCTNTGTIISSGTYGTATGIACIMNNSTLVNCVNSGFIKGSYGSFGICAGVATAGGSQHITIAKCINSGVLGADGCNIGASIVGSISGNVTITDCFYDIQMCKYKAVNNQDHSGVTGLPTHLLMEELAK
jgi:hypothetical protein